MISSQQVTALSDFGFERQMSSCKIALISLLVAFAAFSSKGRCDAATDIVQKTYFGIHIHRLVHTQPWLTRGKRVTPWPEVEFGTWRLWDAYVSWPNLQPEREQWNFRTLDKYVAWAAKANIELLLPLGLTPAWASIRPNEKSGYQLGNAAEPRDIEDWRKYVRTIATRYRGRIRHYELWNEVNYPHFFSGSQAKLLELARVAYETIKSIDPNAVVVSPSVTGGGRHLEWFDSYLEQGGGNYADVISYHFYVPKSPPEAMLPLVEAVRQILQKHGLEHKELWNTETGWWIPGESLDDSTNAVSEDWLRLDNHLAAAYVARSLILAKSAGISRFYWYSWDNVDMGLIEPDTLKLKPAAKAYEILMSWMIGEEMNGCRQTDSLWLCRQSPESEQPSLLLWSDNGLVNWKVPTEWVNGTVEYLDGRHVTPIGSELGIDQLPVRLVRNKSRKALAQQ